MAALKTIVSTLFCVSGVMSAVNFSADEVTQLRDDIRELIEDNELGINENSPTLAPVDILFKFELPIIASAIRLAFHDCSGEFPNTKCDGCLDFAANANDGIFEGSADPLSSICNEYKTNYQLSIGDCWALASIFGLELSGELTNSDWEEINTFYNGNLNNNDFPKRTVKPGDIPYYIGRIDCDTAPDVAPGVDEDFPGPPNDWQDILEYFERFDLTTKETVALIVGGHSIGRSHLNVANRAGPWDISPNTVDNEYAKALLGENRLLEPFNWQSGTPFRRQHFFIENEDFTNIYGDPFVVDKAFLMFSADISLAYNRTYYSNNRLQPECFTQAELFCPQNYPGSIVLYPGDSDDLNDYPAGTTLCPQVQCPVQCIGGQDEIDSYKNSDYMNLPDTYQGCPAAWIRQFADDEDEFAETFIRAYTIVITAGYQIAPIKVGNSGSSSSSSSDDFTPDPNVDYLYEIDIDYDNLDSSDSSSDS